MTAVDEQIKRFYLALCLVKLQLEKEQGEGRSEDSEGGGGVQDLLHKSFLVKRVKNVLNEMKAAIANCNRSRAWTRKSA